jgi:hypothetical protein
MSNEPVPGDRRGVDRAGEEGADSSGGMARMLPPEAALKVPRKYQGDEIQPDAI